MYCSQGRLGAQVDSMRNRCEQTGDLPFADVLSQEEVEQVLQEEGVSYRERLYTPGRTLFLWLFQTIHADKSCLAAVMQLIAWLVQCGRRACSAETKAYCQARARLPLRVIQRLVRETAQNVHRRAGGDWLWKGRRVRLVDGTTLIMPDTPANQAEYPQQATQQPGLGFPIVRLVGVFCLATGMMLELALGKYQGKQQGENSLARTLYDQFDPGDLMLADTYFCSYFDIAMLQKRDVDSVFRLHQRRRVDFRRGKKLGKNDHLVTWSKPPRPEWMSQDVYDALPDELTLREVRLRRRVRADKRGKLRKKSKKKWRQLIVVTTLLDPNQVTKAELSVLYRARWHVELDFRNIKQTLGMDMLRCKTPEMVRKEIWMHMLGYNLIRTLMAQAAWRHGLLPRQISFKATCQFLLALGPGPQLTMPLAEPTWHELLLGVIARCRVGDRPDRHEPRAVKRRPKQYPHLNEPRHQAKARLQKQVMA